jgi:hypothetical protein
MGEESLLQQCLHFVSVTVEIQLTSRCLVECDDYSLLDANQTLKMDAMFFRNVDAYNSHTAK